MHQSFLTIVGPTGVGKTAYAVELAQKFGGELISADSRQVYIGMDIATGKEVDQGDWVKVHNRPTLAIEGVLIHGLDVVEPDQDFSVADWVKLAHQLSKEISSRGKVPIIVGGTGFYLDGLQGKIETLNIPPNSKLRTDLSMLTVEQLQERLGDIDGAKLEGMNTSDRRNPARLMRAIEVTEHVSQTGSASHLNFEPLRLCLLGLMLDRTRLQAKVDLRIDQMFDQGLVEETRRLVDRYGRSSQAMTGIGYAEVSALLAGEISLDQAKRQIKQRTHDYIKRQQTWFAKQHVDWIDVGQPGWSAEADRKACSYFDAPGQ